MTAKISRFAQDGLILNLVAVHLKYASFMLGRFELEVTVILLNWNTAKDTIRCIEDIMRWQQLQPTVWVLDNASNDGSADQIAAECPVAHLIRSQINLGYAGGNNKVLSEALLGSNAPVLLMNNDAKISEADLSHLLQTLKHHPEIGILGPLLFDAERREKLLTAGGQNVVLHLSSHISKFSPDQLLQIVDYIPGTVLLSRAELFAQVGLLDEAYFFSGELPDFCYRARQQGYLSAIATQARAYHRVSRSSHFRETLYTYYIIRNRYLFIRKFYRGLPKASLFLFWTGYNLTLSFRVQLKGKPHSAQAIRMGLWDGLRGNFGGQNERVLAACLEQNNSATNSPRCEAANVKILYHITNLPPKIAGTEASLQELDALRDHFGGDLIHLNPNQISPVYLPRLLFGFHRLRTIRATEQDVQLHHLYNADSFPFPVVRWWRRPVIYSISSGIGPRRPNLTFFNAVAAVVVSDEQSFERLEQWGLKNCHFIRPGVDIHGFDYTPLPLRSTIRLMVGSAPWTKPQFHSKGIEALLAAAQLAPALHLICLWRGVLAEEMHKRVRQLNLENQVEIINRKVDVNQVLARVHASITLVTDPAIIRPYPHSLVESLAAGKPVLVSRAIPMASYVEYNNYGQVVEGVTAGAILTAVRTLKQNYTRHQQATQAFDRNDFSKKRMIESYDQIYKKIAAQSLIGN